MPGPTANLPANCHTVLLSVDWGEGPEEHHEYEPQDFNGALTDFTEARDKYGAFSAVLGALISGDGDDDHIVTLATFERGEAA